MNKNQIYWVVAILVINGGWASIAGNTVSQEINRPGADFSYEREADIGTLFSEDKIPISIECSFTSINGENHEVGWELVKEGKLIASWNGNSSENCIGWAGEVNGGSYVVRTLSNESLETTITLNIQPFEPLRYHVHIAMTFLMIIFGFLEDLVRKFWPKTKKKELEKTIVEEINVSSVRNEGVWQDPIRQKKS
ncbi:MAG: hypothetical protein QGI21_05370 [Candidatus Poseidoniaceae archaeon]|jgi:hypothetical protein|nr:hypothetical protein [Candidatus Poseidoniaceae archaeon]